MAKKKNDKRPIIIVEGAPEWMVTFGDLMSLLLTFFILLFSMSEIKQQKIYEVFESFKVHFNVTAPTQGFHVEQLEEVINLLSKPTLDLPDQKEGTEGKTRVVVDDPFGSNAEVIMIKNSLLVAIEGSVSFDEHSAVLKQGAKDVLNSLATKLSDSGLRLEIRAHANPSPIPEGSSYSDHWQLSFMRAVAVKNWLKAKGPDKASISEDRIELTARGKFDISQQVNLLNVVERRKLDRVEILIVPENTYQQDLGLGRN